MTARRHLTKSGRFEVYREAPDGLICLRHVPTGLPFGAFSHLCVKSFRQALAGVEQAESETSFSDWVYIDAGPGSRVRQDWPTNAKAAARRLQDAMTRAFPRGAWSR